MSESDPARDWLRVLRRYVAFSTVAHVSWEVAHVPLYTIWRDGTAGEIAFAVVHCTGGDVMIASLALLAALVVVGGRDWPLRGYRRVGALALAFGFAYTIFSEWLNTDVRGSWAYAEAMPLLPVLGTGLTPVLQWIAVPAAALWWARRR